MSSRQQREAREPFISIGQRIADARERAGLNQDQLAERLGRSGSWLSEIERGINRPPLYETYRIAEILKYPIEFFVDPNFNPFATNRPNTPYEWMKMYPDDPLRAQMFATMDRILTQFGIEPGTVSAT